MSYIGKHSMSQCLYLIQSDYCTTQAALDKLRKIYQQGDAVMLMGEAALLAETADLSDLEMLYLLDHDAQALSVLPSNIQCLSYAQFAEVCLTYTRCIRLK